MGRGYSFDVIRARLLFDDEARQDTRTTIRKRVAKVAQQPSVREFVMDTKMARPTFPRVLVEEESVIEYGPYIPTLVRKLEAGNFD